MPKKILKGGLGSGHWGHSGLPGIHGGSKPRGSGFSNMLSLAERGALKFDDRQTAEGAAALSAHERRLAAKLLKHPIITVYHGTPKDNVESITENGLKVGTEWYGRPPSIYFLTDKDEADTLIKNFVFTKEFAIVKAEVPREFLKGIRIDEPGNRDFNTKTAAYIPKNIPAEFITEIEMYTREYTKEKAAVVHTDTIKLKEESDTQTIYIVLAFTGNKKDISKVGVL